MFNPIATYRIQFHKDFTLQHFENILPYLEALGISAVYASPVFEAVAGSNHGYDSVSPHTINPEIGKEDKFTALLLQLKKNNIGWVQDIVPNHMAFHPKNEWLMDLLEKGSQSAFTSFFDTAWSSDFYKGKLMVPFLNATPETAIQSGELKIAFLKGKLVFTYYDALFPIKEESYSKVFGNEWKARFKEKDAALEDFITYSIETGNRDVERLLALLEEQVYRLCYYQEADTNINYRRFFTVNSLICLNIHDKEVFNEYHKTIKKFVDRGLFSGLRVDHIDGLFNPSQYLVRLRKLAGDESYIVVEKILEPGETLHANWPVQGTTGYDFMATVNAVFTNKASEQSLTDFYETLLNGDPVLREDLSAKKAAILYKYMGGELENLFQFFLNSNLVDPVEKTRIELPNLKTALGIFLILCPVYRYYGILFPLAGEEEEALSHIFNMLRSCNPELTEEAGMLERVLLEKPKAENEAYRKRVLNFYQRCMQFTGPLMAKGLEDTLMYTYNRFIGHNEVGDTPECTGLSPAEFHDRMAIRQKKWPFSMNATSTHDTKRGEDIRARLNVITDVPEKWIQKVLEWKTMNSPLIKDAIPDANDEYFIYQNLLGAYPMPGERKDDIVKRMQLYLEKALREAKVHTNYNNPNAPYEDGVQQFIENLFNPEHPFLNNFLDFHGKISDYGITNSICQLVLKFMCPGIPDVYQGCELWDLSLVDPDNRRPVDFQYRIQVLNELDKSEKTREQLLLELWKERNNGKIKLWMSHVLFTVRKSHSELFHHGSYLPLKTSGKYKDNVLAFARSYNNKWWVTVLPLHLADISGFSGNLTDINWDDTAVLLPGNAPNHVVNHLTKIKSTHNGIIAVKDLFSEIPFALLYLEPERKRASGVLMHITSLPSAFGIGDLGPDARNFARYLSGAGQTFWQLLPLNPIGFRQAFSPYSSVSSMAGNTLLISPELLAHENLIDNSELNRYKLVHTDKVVYTEVKMAKNAIFERAWQNYKLGDFRELKKDFLEFCVAENFWLNDFALYVVIKGLNAGKPWHEWQNEALKNYDRQALEKLSGEHAHGIEKTKWLQFLFFRQWKQLRTYCSNLGIQLVGDVPFYVGHNSVDVWAHKELFALDSAGHMSGIAGVPPDAFSDEGQLWGMPVYQWEVHKKDGYQWWIQRFRKNIELFDLVRLDHFRAFASYWEVPAAAATAKEGIWKAGPGASLFIAAEKALGHLPFIAEDLGEINDEVFALRNQFKMPGMKVLQFAFGDEMPWSDFTPHNYSENFIVYPGTHDNNTSRGWGRMEGKQDITRLEQYVGTALKEEEVADALIRLAMGSVARTAILPLQDLLNLDETARMNRPSSVESNWVWRLLPGQLTPELLQKLKALTILYNRNK